MAYADADDFGRDIGGFFTGGSTFSAAPSGGGFSLGSAPSNASEAFGFAGTGGDRGENSGGAQVGAGGNGSFSISAPANVSEAFGYAGPQGAYGPSPVTQDSLGQKLRDGRIGDISINPAAALGGLAGTLLGGPVGGALFAAGGKFLGDKLGLDDDVTLGDLFGDFDVSLSPGGGAAPAQTGVPGRDNEQQYASVSDRVSTPGAARPAPQPTPGVDGPAPQPAPGVDPRLIYGPYFDQRTGGFQPTGPYADIARAYGVYG